MTPHAGAVVARSVFLWFALAGFHPLALEAQDEFLDNMLRGDAGGGLIDGTASLDDLFDRLGAGYDDASPGSLTGGAGATGATELTAITTGRPAEGWPIHKGGQNGHEIP